MEPMKKRNSPPAAELSSLDAASLDLESPVGPHAMPPPDPPLDSRRRSQSNPESESGPQAPSPCATREAPEEGCAFQRFIVWAAVKRNKSVRMVASERLKCPLVLCGERFDDHETMLSHLTKCQHLRTGEYVCYDCMKIERFNDSKCRCCLGHPTKRRRIINMAKTLFSNIGSRSRGNELRLDIRGEFTMPPPSYESLMAGVGGLERQRCGEQQRQHQQEEQQPQPQIQPQLELNGREIHELDSRQMAELGSINYDTQSIGMPMALDQCDTTSETTARPHTNLCSNPGEDDVPNLDEGTSLPSATPMYSSPGARRPSLAVNTRMDHYRNVSRTKYLSPSSSLRSTTSQNVSPVTPWSANSGVSGAYTLSSTIDTEITSPITPVSPYELPPLPQHEDILAIAKSTTSCPNNNYNYTTDSIPELPGDDPRSIPRGLADLLFFSLDPKDNYSWMESVSTELSLATSVNMMFAGSEPKSTTIQPGFLEPLVPGSGARTLVESAWDALQEHVTSSVGKLDHIKGNPLAERIRTQSSKAIAFSGLSSLKGMLQDNIPTDPFDLLCFVHLIYAFSLVVHEDEPLARCNLLYQQALGYRRFLDPVHITDYTDIVKVIWQPTPDGRHQPQAGSSQHADLHYKGKEREGQPDSGIRAGSDPLVIAGQDFLDDLEHVVITSDSQKPEEVLTSELWSTHIVEFQPGVLHNDPFSIAVDYIIGDLVSTFHDSEILLSKLREVGQKVRDGYITTVRKFELSILQTGKHCLTSSDLFDDFIPRVRRLCNPIYSEQGTHSRIRYQLLGVSLVEALIQAIPSSPQESASFPYNEFLETLHDTFDNNPDFLETLDAVAPPQNQAELEAAQSFGTTGIPFPHIGSSAPASTTASRSLTTTASHVGTPNESFSASPDLSRPIALATSPKPPTPAHAEASEKQFSSSQKVEANDACEFCGYRPKGDPQWFKGSMAKHKKMQHSAGPPVIYKCPYPGCNSQYKNRQDNLRQHQIEKNHFVGDEATRRPSKRKKVSVN
ncbi:hypothetical protein GGS23DRAFT_28663 [Durotheca rogersii]|uniref:uncharacterized protein n=1 Tax=Durotheca rogersii TaxID=419775 RepID=UPI002220A0AB|nr:uncharacterized protein GGS23DRAFT_28663 [Durotheca rogersii]KAI5868417.1 hypothetical protein GGS23DRAFT_28663 [Durotheca rogersii]